MKKAEDYEEVSEQLKISTSPGIYIPEKGREKYERRRELIIINPGSAFDIHSESIKANQEKDEEGLSYINRLEKLAKKGFINPRGVVQYKILNETAADEIDPFNEKEIKDSYRPNNEFIWVDNYLTEARSKEMGKIDPEKLEKVREFEKEVFRIFFDHYKLFENLDYKNFLAIYDDIIKLEGNLNDKEVIFLVYPDGRFLLERPKENMSFI